MYPLQGWEQLENGRSESTANGLPSLRREDLRRSDMFKTPDPALVDFPPHNGFLIQVH